LVELSSNRPPSRGRRRHKGLQMACKLPTDVRKCSGKCDGTRERGR
jgi:hypothetical protein